MALDGLDKVLRDLQSFQRDVKRLVNGELRRESKAIADSAVPLVKRLVASGPAPQSRKMADTVRARSDRTPLVIVGAVNPKLSGFNRGAKAARQKGSLAWGVERGPRGGPQGRARSNVYGVGRRERGYKLQPNMDRIADAVVPAYADALAAAMERADLYTRML